MTKKQWLIVAMIAVPLVGAYFKIFALFLVLPLWWLRPKQ